MVFSRSPSEMPRPSALEQGFPPAIDAGIETLILGSFPGVASLAKAQYYGHPQNQFWRLMGAVIGQPLTAMEYHNRLIILNKYRIGVWDIIAQCQRKGSLDSNIRQARHNDYAHVTDVARSLRLVCFNGKTAGRMAPVFAAMGYDTLILPSSSPAYTMRFEDKLKHWRLIGASGSAARPVRTAARSRSSPSSTRRGQHAD
jgi:double-stranded uracil-DNA glycosylase